MKLIASFGIYIILLFNFSIPAKSQSMTDLFLRLPSNCTPGLYSIGRQTLVKDTQYTVPGKKEVDEIDYSIDTVSENYLAYEFSNSKGRGTNENYELKKFKKTDGSYILLFSKTGDIKVHSNIYVLKTFDITGNTLTEKIPGLIPENLDYSSFLKSNISDSVKTKLAKTAYTSFDLDAKAPGRIIFRIILQSDKDVQWLIGNSMVFTWNGAAFTSSILFEREE